MTWQFTLTGLLIGSLVGLTGMGGGSLMTPILILFFGFQPTLAVGTDILHGAVFKSFGAVRHRKLGTVHLRIAFWMFLGSAPMSLVGVELANWIENQYGSGVGDAMAKVIGWALILGGLGFLAKTFIKRGVQPSNAPFLLTNRDRVICVALGASGGFLVGLTSVGSGTFFGLVMLLVFPLTAAKIVGTDIFHAAALLWVAGISYLVHGNVDLHAMAWLLLGSIPGVLFASKLTVKVPEGALRVGLGTVLLASGVRLIEFPHYTILVPVDPRAGRDRSRAHRVPAAERPRGRGSLGDLRRGVVAPASAGALGEVGERRPLEDLDRRVAHLAPRPAQRVGHELRHAVGTPPRRVADRGELPLEEADDPLERDLVGRLVQPVAAGGPALGTDEARRAHDWHHLLEHGLGRSSPLRELLEFHRTVAVKRESEERARRVIGSAGDPHVRIVACLTPS